VGLFFFSPPPIFFEVGVGGKHANVVDGQNLFKKKKQSGNNPQKLKFPLFL
jgi:hypothetical protein